MNAPKGKLFANEFETRNAAPAFAWPILRYLRRREQLQQKLGKTMRPYTYSGWIKICGPTRKSSLAAGAETSPTMGLLGKPTNSPAGSRAQCA